MSNDLISRKQMLEQFGRNNIYRSITNAAGKNVLEIVQEMPGYDGEETAAYICDMLCRHRHNINLTQDELDDICAKCNLGSLLGITGEETKNPGDTEAWKRRIMRKFTEVH